MTNKTTKHHSSDFYDSYDYSTFWQGRDYEDCSDNIAVSRFLKQTTMHRSIVDVGGGLGRLVPQYAGIYDTAVLLDPSGVQLEKTKFRIGAKYPNVSFVKGIAEELPFADGSVDTIVCIRVTHHIPNFSKPIEEYKRVLAPGGYLILEVANKLHMKSRINAFRTGKTKKILSGEVVKVGKNNDGSILFVNHNPKTMKKLLIEKGFEIISTRSVSNFRLAFLKKYVPLGILLFFERLLQKPLAAFWFGPSIYFFARKKS